MSTDIKYYLKYYLGCEAFFDNRKWLIDFYDVRQNIVRLRRTDDGYPKYNEVWPNEMKLILRRLSSITEEEAIELAEADDFYVFKDSIDKMRTGYNIIRNNEFRSKAFHYLLSRGFWLWDDEAFEKGLIIEKK